MAPRASVSTDANPGAARTIAGILALACAATLAAVWIMQSRGYAPCELCLKERIPFYLALPPALALAGFGQRLPGTAHRAIFALLILLFAAGAVTGLYHAGVEWAFWAGPTECSGATGAPADVNDFLKQLHTVAVVRCDQAALKVLGLSLAAWNALLSAGLAALAGLGWRRAQT